MPSRLTVIYNATSLEHANLLQQFLVERGIRANVENNAFGAMTGDLDSEKPASPSVTVADRDAEAARHIARLFDRHIHTRSGLSATEVDCVSHWPECPQCCQPRQAVCPSCKEAGNHFPQADSPITTAEKMSPESGCSSVVPTDASPISDRDDLPLWCLLCDEVFQAQFYRHCEWCGHDFGNGIDLTTSYINPVSVRERAIVGLLVGITIGTLSYLVWLFR